MTHITIRNIGPVREASIDLNRVNVFMGPQSSGKSTIAKIISYCTWYEKNFILKSNLSKENFLRELITFHNLENDYFDDSSCIEYVSDCFHLVYEYNEVTKAEPKNDCVFKNRKVEYIPAERNLVSLPGFAKYNDTRDNILNFLYDWYQAKQSYTEGDKYELPIPAMNTSYFYDKNSDTDYIHIDNGRKIGLRHASSGLMSVTPLIVVFDYILKGIYSRKNPLSPSGAINFKDALQDAIDKAVKEGKNTDQLVRLMGMLVQIKNDYESQPRTGESFTQFLSSDEQLDKIVQPILNLMGFHPDYVFSNIIIEEPELNLFPNTQRDLVYYMLESVCNPEREHVLTLTTHSPYILFALNNCMMGGLVHDKIDDSVKENLCSAHSWIDPKMVSIYEIHSGELVRIQDEDGIIDDNYLNKAYKEITSEYLSLLEFYDEE